LRTSKVFSWLSDLSGCSSVSRSAISLQLVYFVFTAIHWVFPTTAVSFFSLEPVSFAPSIRIRADALSGWQRNEMARNETESAETDQIVMDRINEFSGDWKICLLCAVPHSFSRSVKYFTFDGPQTLWVASPFFLAWKMLQRLGQENAGKAWNICHRNFARNGRKGGIFIRRGT